MSNNNNKQKRKRGRPPKKKPELPKFNNEREIREFILNCSLELALECNEIAAKKNNIKQPSIANAKNQQYKTAIASLKTANDILKDLQINKLEEKVQLMEEGLTASVMVNNNDSEVMVNNNDSEERLSSETLEKIDKLTDLTEQLAKLKE